GGDTVAKMLLEGEPALIVLIAPAEVADRADIDEADVERLVLGRGGSAEAERQSRGGQHEVTQFHQLVSPVLIGGDEGPGIQLDRAKTRPRLAGALRLARVRSAEMKTSTRMVMR